MMYESLPTLLSADWNVDDETILYADDNCSLRYSEFRQSVELWRKCLHDVEEQFVALYHNDAWQFTSALFACWSLGKTVLLPPNNLTATQKGLSAYTSTYLGELNETADQAAYNEADKLPRDVALIVFTSGSTGKPELVSKTFDQLNAEVDSLHRCFHEHVANAMVVAMVSHHHQYGLIFKILWPLLTGRIIYRNELRYFEQLPKFLEKNNVVLIASPAHLSQIPGSLAIDDFKHKVQAVFSAGANLPAAAIANSQSLLNCEPTNIYGSTEAGACAWQRGLSAQYWQALPSVKCRMHETGCLFIESPALHGDGGFLSADKVRLADNGQFQLLGRADTIVKLAGKRVSMTAIESLLCRDALVKQVRVVQHPSRQDRLGAVIVLNDNGAAALIDRGQRSITKGLGDLIACNIEAVARPRYWRFVKSLPSDSLGKTSLDSLSTLFLKQEKKLIPDLIASVVHSEHSVELKFNVEENLHYLQGHFPANPVLPGVVQIAWAEHFAQKYFNISGDFSELSAVKFQNIIRPGLLITLKLEWLHAGGKLLFSYTSERQAHSSGRIVFSEEN